MRRVFVLCALVIAVTGVALAQVPAEPETPGLPGEPAVAEPQAATPQQDPEPAGAVQPDEPGEPSADEPGEEPKAEEPPAEELPAEEPPAEEPVPPAATPREQQPTAPVPAEPTTAAAGREGEQPDENDITNGEFALLLLQALATHPKPDMPPDEALTAVQDLELMDPELDWEDPMVHQTLADVLGKMGVLYQPAEAQDFVSHAFAEAMLRRHLLSIRQFRGWLVRHGVTDDNFMDEGGDRRVSPFEFQ